MITQRKKTIFDSFFLFIRRTVVLAVIFVVIALAFFRESLPDSLKIAMASFAGDHSPQDDDLIPHRFRIDKSSRIQNIASEGAALPLMVENTPMIENASKNQNAEIDTKIETSQHIRVDDRTKIKELHTELAEMGATSCKLTLWGNSSTMYRFSCHIPVSRQGVSATRQFQSIAPSATQSMQEVIDQIRQWQSSRS